VCMGSYQNMASPEFWQDGVVVKYGQVASTDEHIDAMYQVSLVAVAADGKVQIPEGSSNEDLAEAFRAGASAKAAAREGEKALVAQLRMRSPLACSSWLRTSSEGNSRMPWRVGMASLPCWSGSLFLGLAAPGKLACQPLGSLWNTRQPESHDSEAKDHHLRGSMAGRVLACLFSRDAGQETGSTRHNMNLR
jgi:hypothetical protein